MTLCLEIMAATVAAAQFPPSFFGFSVFRKSDMKKCAFFCRDRLPRKSGNRRNELSPNFSWVYETSRGYTRHTLVLFSERVRCQVAVKGSGPILVMVLPAYPYAARNQHLEGVGLFRLNIKPDSTVGSVTVLKTSGHTLLGGAAIDALRQWRFRPGALRMLKVPMNFTMKGLTH